MYVNSVPTLSLQYMVLDAQNILRVLGDMLICQ